MVPLQSNDHSQQLPSPVYNGPVTSWHHWVMLPFSLLLMQYSPLAWAYHVPSGIFVGLCPIRLLIEWLWYQVTYRSFWVIGEKWARPYLRQSHLRTIIGDYMVTWQCGWGLEQPIIFPLFSNICTQSYVFPRSTIWLAHSSTTWRMSVTSISGRLRSERGWKQITRLDDNKMWNG